VTQGAYLTAALAKLELVGGLGAPEIREAQDLIVAALGVDVLDLELAGISREDVRLSLEASLAALKGDAGRSYSFTILRQLLTESQRRTGS
jgi:hypothetical protein